MSDHAVRIATIRGIEVRLDPTLLVLALLLVWSFFGRFAADHGTGTAVVMAVAGMVLILASILAHELAHALEAIHRGIGVESITLLLFGGVTQMHTHSARPRDEFSVAAVGPFVSLLAGAVFGLVHAAATTLPAGVDGPTADLAGLLALLNVLLAVFNLFPGAPLDGGRVLRAGLWAVLGDRARAIRWAARSGQILGLGLAAFGGYILLRAPQAAIGALWWVAIGAFLVWAAGTEHRHSRLDELYTATTVRHLLAYIDPPPHAAMADDASALPILDLDTDLHALVDAFMGATRRIVLTERGTPQMTVTERQVAQAIGRLRRGHQPVHPVPETSAR